MFEDNESEDSEEQAEEPFMVQAKSLYDDLEHQIGHAVNTAYNFHDAREMTFDYFIGLCWVVRNAESALKEAKWLDRDYGLNECESRRLAANVEYAKHIRDTFLHGGNVVMPFDISNMPTTKSLYSGKRKQ